MMCDGPTVRMGVQKGALGRSTPGLPTVAPAVASPVSGQGPGGRQLLCSTLSRTHAASTSSTLRYCRDVNSVVHTGSMWG